MGEAIFKMPYRGRKRGVREGRERERERERTIAENVRTYWLNAEIGGHATISGADSVRCRP